MKEHKDWKENGWMKSERYEEYNWLKNAEYREKYKIDNDDDDSNTL